MGKKWQMLAVWPARKIRDWARQSRGDDVVPYTSIHVCVPAPQVASDIPTISISLSTGRKHTVRFRVRDWEHWEEIFYPSADVRQRIQAGLEEAHRQVAEMIEDNRLSELRRQGVGLVRMDTGEIVSEAERIVTATK